MKLGLAILVALAIAAPAGATVYPTGGTNPQDITITLVIPCYTQVYWNSAVDQTILFNDIVQNGSNGGDWYSTMLTGAYGAAPKSSQDAFATDYYESYDNANFWLKSNCNTTMTLTSSGNLKNGTATLPTWYTMALTNGMNCVQGTNCGFINNGARLRCGTIPNDGDGCYAADVTPVDNLLDAMPGTPFYPNQFSFPMQVGAVGTVYTGNFLAYAEGTILFHARVLRNALADAAGTYTATLAVNFN